MPPDLAARLSVRRSERRIGPPIGSLGDPQNKGPKGRWSNPVAPTKQALGSIPTMTRYANCSPSGNSR